MWEEGSKASFEEVLKTHQNLAYSIANDYRNSGVPLEDLRQESLLGLYKAYERYQPERETLFSTYAVFWIKKQVLEAIKQESGMQNRTEQLDEVHLDRLVAIDTGEGDSQALKLPPYMPQLEQDILRLSYAANKSLKEIAVQLNISVERVKQHKQKALRRLRNQHPDITI